MADGTFHYGSDFIGGDPFTRVTLDAGKHTEVHVVVSISGPSFFGGAAGLLTVADPLPFYHVDFRTDPFVTVRASLFMAVPGIFHVQAAVFRAGGVSVHVVADFFKSTFISGVIRNQDPGKMAFIFQETIGFNCVKRGIPKKGTGMKVRVQRKEIGEYRLQ